MGKSVEGQFGAKLFKRFRQWSAAENPTAPDPAPDQYNAAIAEGHAKTVNLSGSESNIQPEKVPIK